MISSQIKTSNKQNPEQCQILETILRDLTISNIYSTKITITLTFNFLRAKPDIYFNVRLKYIPHEISNS